MPATSAMQIGLAQPLASEPPAALGSRPRLPCRVPPLAAVYRAVFLLSMLVAPRPADAAVALSVELGFKRGMPVMDSNNFDKVGPYAHIHPVPGSRGKHGSPAARPGAVHHVVEEDNAWGDLEMEEDEERDRGAGRFLAAAAWAGAAAQPVKGGSSGSSARAGVASKGVSGAGAAGGAMQRGSSRPGDDNIDGAQTPASLLPFKAHNRPVGASTLLVGSYTAGGRAGSVEGPTGRGHLESSQSEDSMWRDVSPPPHMRDVADEDTVRRHILAREADVIDVLQRPLTVGCAVTGVAHLRHRTLMLHVAVDEKHTWKAPLEPQDAEPGDVSVRKALIDLPYLAEGTHYLAVTCYLPGFARALATVGARHQDALKDWLVLGIVGLRFTLSCWQSKDSINQELVDVTEIRNANSASSARPADCDKTQGASEVPTKLTGPYAPPCAVCRMTIHAAGHICLRDEEEEALKIEGDLMPSYLANKLALQSPTGWARKS